MSILGNPLIVGGGLSQCSAVIYTETGSTVAAYSDAACTVKVRDGREVGVSGSYVITGLPVGSYYIKAAKGTKVKVSEAVTFSGYAVVSLHMPYEFVIFENGVFDPSVGTASKVAGDAQEAYFRVVNNHLQCFAADYLTSVRSATYKLSGSVDLTNYAKLVILGRGHIYSDYQGVGSKAATVGINQSGTGLTHSVELTESGSASRKEIDISALSGDWYLLFHAACNSTQSTYGAYGSDIEKIWLE